MSTFFGILTFFSSLHPQKVPGPIFTTVSGIIISFKAVLYVNTPLEAPPDSISSIPGLIITFVIVSCPLQYPTEALSYSFPLHIDLFHIEKY